MSTIKSSTEHLTLNADGSGKEIKLQANGVEKAKVTSTGIDVTGSVTCDGLTVDSTAVVGTMPNTQGFTGESAYASRLRIGTSATVSGEAGQGLLQIQGYTPGSGTACGTIEFLDKRDNDSIVKMVAERSNGGFGSGELHIKTNTGSDTFTTNATFPSTGGITFNGDTAAANALDDYEEGTWTPALTAYAGTNPTVGGTKSGWYTKVGNLVTIGFKFDTLGVSGVTSGLMLISNLPYSISSSTPATGAINTHQINFTRSGNNTFLPLGTAGFGILSSNNNGNWDWETCAVAVAANAAIRGSMTYMTP